MKAKVVSKEGKMFLGSWSATIRGLRGIIFMLVFFLRNLEHVDAWSWLMVGNWSSTNFTLPCNSTYYCINLPYGNSTYSLDTFRCQGVLATNEQWDYDNQSNALSLFVTPPSERMCLDATQNTTKIFVEKCNGSLGQQWFFKESKIYNNLGLYLRVPIWIPADWELFDQYATQPLEANSQINSDNWLMDFTLMPNSTLANIPALQPADNTSNLISNGRFEYVWGDIPRQRVGDLTEICYWTALEDNNICTVKTNTTSAHYLQLASISQTVYTYIGLEHLLTFQTHVHNDGGCSQYCDVTQPIYINISIYPSSLEPTVIQVGIKDGEWDMPVIKFFANSSSVNLTLTTVAGYNECKPSLTNVQMRLLPNNFDNDNTNLQPHWLRKHGFSWLDVGLILGSVGSWAIVCIIGCGIFIWKRHRKKLIFFDVKDLDIQPRDKIRAHMFDLSDNFLLTDGFKDAHCIGQGGFAKVYHGKNLDGTNVAIKRALILQPFSRFYEEVDMLSKVHHRRLVDFLGYYDANGKEQILVFELMANGSLHKHIHDPEMTPLSIDQRFKIAQDVAQGLEYLHHGANPPIIHRDVKSSNVLLTEKFSAKLADFGIFKISHDNTTEMKTTSISTVVRGTYGYMDPQNFQTGTISTKSDVYAFGVLLLELISGRKAIHEDACLSEWGLNLLENNENWLHHMIDPSINVELSSFEVSQLEIMGMVAQRCLQIQREERPNMFEVTRMLGGPWRV